MVKPSRKKRPRDPNQLAKAIVDDATGEAPPDEPEPEPEKNPAAVALGRPYWIPRAKILHLHPNVRFYAKHPR